MRSAEIRKTFLEFFRSKGHEVVRSSSLVPAGDPTLLFTNAGMNQFKDVFLGLEHRPYRRAASAQKCVRAGGKHNDLEHVGYTARHHTFFEMLGNFSFGDYFKREAIHYAWELVTRVFALPPERLWVTVYAEDEEAYQIWRREIGVPSERVVRIGDNKGERFASDNFWMMGDTGPCGPCTEIFYDHGPEIPGGPPGSADADGDRFVEIWNLVFMQYNRDEQGEMHPLPKPSVDTGMGLERVAAVLQGVHSNYEIDLFRQLTSAAQEVLGLREVSASVRVLADHIRAAGFLIADGVLPGNEGRGYVLRRIIRRAVRHGWKLGAREPFFFHLVAPLVSEMGEAYPELKEREEMVAETIREEEERFLTTIGHGMAALEEAVAALAQQGGTVLDGEVAFRLHDTFGFPLDLTADILRERGLCVDAAGFERAMARQRERARAAGKFRMNVEVLDYRGPATLFLGYEQLRAESEVLALYREGVPVVELREGERGVVILAETPFYAEGGGQVGDRGELWSNSGAFAVEDTQRVGAGVHGHHGVMTAGRIRLGEVVRAQVDETARQRTARHHSATHLLHKALREVLGSHVEQRGSEVAPERLRFDFAHGRGLTLAEIAAVEERVAAEVLANTAVVAEVMPLAAARERGAVMLFGEKYGEEVRVVAIGSSLELCGGTHVRRTGDIGLVKIISEGAIAAGVRRIEAVAGTAALAAVQAMAERLQQTAEMLRVAAEEVPARVSALMEALRRAEKGKERAELRAAAAMAETLAARAVATEGVKRLVARVEVDSMEGLKRLADAVCERLGPEGAVLLGAVVEGKGVVVAAVGKRASAQIAAGEWVRRVAARMGGRGGGRSQWGQAGGGDAELLDAALTAA
ncbi:MAG: alanine--tRNA ligase [Hydrogenophilus sp.]|nr:alanine--tRNA ligase [Hydrogenophilus sp.]